MLCLKLVKTAEEEACHIVLMDEAESGQIMSEEGLLHGAKVMRDLVMPWMHTDRIVCGDSYLASVPVAYMMIPYDMRFVGVVKSATQQYSMPAAEVCAMIDCHNRHQQATMGIENKLVTQNWSMRVNLTIFSMIIVYTWLAYSQCKGEGMMAKKQKTFYTLLAEELIDNILDAPNVRL